MERYLTILAQAVLSVDPNGVSKVRLAKLIYLLHKLLAQQGRVASAKLEFQRLPLGPVPVGFFQLAKNLATDSISVSTVSYGLSYDAELYKIRPGLASSPYEDAVRSLAALTEGQGTSRLVDYTHEEPGWLSHANGEIYALSAADISRKIRFPRSQGRAANTNELQNMQANLVSGMIDDIVQESTALEYPAANKP